MEVNEIVSIVATANDELFSATTHENFTPLAYTSRAQLSLDAQFKGGIGWWVSVYR